MTTAAQKKKLSIFRERDGAPYQPAPKIDGQLGSRHHVIPYFQLLDFWNELILHGEHYPLVRHLTDAITSHLQSYTTTSSDRQKNALLKLLPDVPGYTHDPNGDVPGDGSEWGDFSQLLPWLPGNLFTGPQDGYRTNPPKEDEVEPEVCAAIVGDARYKALRDAHNDITAYRKAPDKATAERVLKTMATHLAGPCAPFPFDERQWEKIGGKWAIKRGKYVPPAPVGRRFRVRGHVDVEIEF
ncbi:MULTISPECIES: hypothetical protein [Streptomyces]|uniref:hypothetical protein n=1 Tax=Streptomyces TaxID=1883 RepID=UPI002249531F|nr:hypothetical protein [Streptomyces sp. JHD 1]MCX2971268.1 hypothetical protein [Streptomyces sp. JHD 1]